MISLDEIERTILELENHDTSFATCEKLAWLYIVKDHLVNPIMQRNAPEEQGSEFLDAISGKDEDALFRVLNEHVEAIKVIYPKEYDALIKKINDI